MSASRTTTFRFRSRFSGYRFQDCQFTNHVFETRDAKLAEHLRSQGRCFQGGEFWEEGTEARRHEGTEGTEGGEVMLPKNAVEPLKAAGVETVDQLRAFVGDDEGAWLDTLTGVDGIGKATAKKVIEFLKRSDT